MNLFLSIQLNILHTDSILWRIACWV